jgi:hypothetical protein
MLYCIYWFAYVELSFHPCSETDLIMVYGLFNVLLNLIYKYFNEIFKNTTIQEIDL